MSELPNDTVESKRAPVIVAIVLIGIVLALLAASWVLTRGVADEDPNQQIPANAPTPGQAVPNQPSGASQSTGGSSGGGTGTSNDPSVVTPSPAGGVDTNGVPASGTPTAP